MTVSSCNFSCCRLGKISPLFSFLSVLGMNLWSFLFWAMCRTGVAAEKWDISNQNTKQLTTQPHAKLLGLRVTFSSLLLPSPLPMLTGVAAVESEIAFSCCQIWNNVKKWEIVPIYKEKEKQKLLLQYKEWDYFLHLIFHHVSKCWVSLYWS